jgi:hypothetical protein
MVNGFPVVVMDVKGPPSPDRSNPPRDPNAIFDNIDWKDKNQEWLSYYGLTALSSSFSYYASRHYHYKFSEVGFNALSFYGTGKRARKIGVPLFTETGSATKFNVGIYSATASGLPGKELAGGSTTASSDTACCTQLRWVDVHVKLKAGRQYFLAVSCGENTTKPLDCYGGWMMEDTGQDYWHVREFETYTFGSTNSTQTFTYSSPWHVTTGIGAGQGAAIIK